MKKMILTMVGGRNVSLDWIDEEGRSDFCLSQKRIAKMLSLLIGSGYALSVVAL